MAQEKSSAPPAQNTKDATTYTVASLKDIEYYTGPDQHKTKHKLDFYFPKGEKNFPVLFFAHGGAWLHGDKNTFGIYTLFASAFVKQRIGVVVINYRLSPEVKHPEHIKDVARAFAWTYNNISKHGGDPENIFLCGHSAGAHLVSLLSTEESWLKEHKLSSKAIKGTIPISAPFIIPPKFLPKVFGDDTATPKKASPLTHVRPEMPPFLILYADKELPGCDKKVAEAFHKAVVNTKSMSELIEITESDHFRILLNACNVDGLGYKRILEFIRKQSAK
jgi:acetyl esterase/lipase